jgi:dienelactone hydrolase
LLNLGQHHAKAGTKGRCIHNAAAQIHIYDNAPHAFHADYRPSYRKEEAEDGWLKMLAWFRKNGV